MIPPFDTMRDMKMPLHLQRHKDNGVWYYLRRTPADLKAIPESKPREYFSLKTSDRREAELLARQWDVKLDEKWRLQRILLNDTNNQSNASKLTARQIQSLADQWLEHLMTEDEEVRQEGLDKRSFNKVTEYLDFGKDLKPMLARGDTHIIDFECQDFISSLGVKVDPDSEAFQRISYAFLKASVKANDLSLQRHQGESIDTPKAEILAVNSYSLDNAFDSWVLQKKRPEASIKEWRSTLVLFKSLHGDIPVAEISKAHIAEFRDYFLKLNLKADTVRKRLTAISSVLKMAVDNDAINFNPALSIKVAKNPMDNQRMEYSLENLRTIFSSPIFTSTLRPKFIGEAAYWVPLIALFTGARQDEILQLTPADIIKDEPTNSYYFDFNTRSEGKSLKTAVSLRQTPIHKELIKIGLLDYHETIKNEAKLFPRVSSANSFSSWWTKYSAEIGVWVIKSKVFHSFRHNFITASRSSGIPEDYRAVIEGHTAGKGAAYDYGTYTLDSKNKWLQKLKFKGLDLSHLYK